MPCAVGDEDPVRPVGHLARPRPVALADLVEQRRAARVGQELAAIADQAADRQDELHPDAAVGVGRHLLEAALPAGERLLDLADVVRRDVDRDPLVRLLDLAVRPSWRRTSGRDTVSSKPSRRICSIRTASWSSPRPRTSNVSPDSVGWTSIETLPRTSRSRRALIWRLVTYLPSRPLQRRGVDAERHPERRRVDVEPRQRARVGRIGDRVADRDLGQAGDRDDVARAAPRRCRRARSRGPSGATVTVPLSVTVRPGSTAPAVSSASSRTTVIRWPDPDRPVPDPPDGHPPDVVVRHQVRDEELERVARRT